MFNLCNGTFRIEGSGGLRKPLQLGCDCQLLKAFVCRVFCCFKGYTLKSPADQTAPSPRKPKYIYCKLLHISVISHINLRQVIMRALSGARCTDARLYTL